MDKPILTNIVGCYQNRNSSQTFLGGNFTSENFKKLSLEESLCTIKQDISLQSTA